MISKAKMMKAKLAREAALVVTDDFPCFVVPDQSAALARKATNPVIAVDSTSMVPLSLLGDAASAAAHFRPRIHKTFAEAWANRADRRPRVSAPARRPIACPFEPWNPRSRGTPR